jgi:hypothetical protein
MNSEIKEKQLNEVLYALDYIGNKLRNDDGAFDDGVLELGVNKCKILSDYITNLQDEIKKYDYELTHKTKQYEFLRHNESKEIKRLSKENQRLLKNLDFMIDKNDEKQKVIDEASGMIQFIAFNSERPLTITELNKVYNILKGEDKE